MLRELSIYVFSRVIRNHKPRVVDVVHPWRKSFNCYIQWTVIPQQFKVQFIGNNVDVFISHLVLLTGLIEPRYYLKFQCLQHVLPPYPETTVLYHKSNGEGFSKP